MRPGNIVWLVKGMANKCASQSWETDRKIKGRPKGEAKGMGGGNDLAGRAPRCMAIYIYIYYRLRVIAI